MTQKAMSNVSDVRAAVREMPEEHLECRHLGHNWRPWTARRVSGSDGGYKGRAYYEAILRCNRCLTQCTERISLAGTILTKHYTYPDGYLLKNMGRIVRDGRAALRLASLKRNFNKLDDDMEGS